MRLAEEANGVIPKPVDFAYIWGDALAELHMVPTQTRRFRVSRASKAGNEWLQKVLNREGRKLGTTVELSAECNLQLTWK